jgi:hypothetical protein
MIIFSNNFTSKNINKTSDHSVFSSIAIKENFRMEI